MRRGLICCIHNTKTRVIANKESVQFSSVQFKMVSMCSEKPVCAPPRLSEFPNVVFETVPMFVSLTMTLSRRFNGRSSSASSFQAIQTIDGVRSLALYPQVVSQASQHFRSSEKQATCEGCFACQSTWHAHGSTPTEVSESKTTTTTTNPDKQTNSNNKNKQTNKTKNQERRQQERQRKQ